MLRVVVPKIFSMARVCLAIESIHRSDDSVIHRCPKHIHPYTHIHISIHHTPTNPYTHPFQCHKILNLSTPVSRDVLNPTYAIIEQCKSICWNSSGSHLASASNNDRLTKLWAYTRGVLQEITPLKGHDGAFKIYIRE